ncbi:hypothetical protein HPB49_023838 [Dermacentor silvarum]|uniref:Uncharacterized protein n=1 Tax=Dermacentor silvarum TaxID=543639 RepID=A0ACB8CTT9_DERSI|nr:hypothetical protein HPB49_023838 [Dermacentor silvarum]
MRRLVDSGRLEPLGGGWVQPDEASCHYSALVDQLTLGMRWLQENLGDCGRPRAAWQVDTWGHSVELASLLSQAGLHGLFLSRLPQNQASHFVWKADASLGEAGEIFTAAARLGWPEGYCFDADCPKDKLTVRNHLRPTLAGVIEKDAAFLSYKRKTNQALISMGGDYQSAAYTYENIDTLIRYINAKHLHLPKVHAFYSTPSCYLRSLLEANEAWTELDEDLFPYTDGIPGSGPVHSPQQTAYWTGYFTTEPNFKRTVRRANGVLQACKQLAVLGFVHSKDIRVFQENVALAQNSEVIAGSERPEVLLQHEALLNNGIARCQVSMVHEASSKTYMWRNQLRFSHCLEAEDDCKPVDSDEAWLLVYNPLSYPYVRYVNLRLKKKAHAGSSNRKLHKLRQNINQRVVFARETRTKFDEVVFSSRLVPLGVTTHYVQRSRESPGTARKPEASRVEKPSKMTVIRNKRYRLLVDSATGLVRGVMIKGGLQVTLQHLFLSYHAYQGSSRKASDSRVLNPVNDDPFELGNNITYHITRGPEVQELHQRYTPWLGLVVRLFENEEVIEFEWTLGPVPLSDHKGKEIVCRFSSSVQSGQLFYTDTNGRRSIERKRLEGSPVASNFYPATSWAFLASDAQSMQLTVFPDRPQGAASLSSGNLEFLIQRRLLGDRGVPVRGRHWLHIGTIADSQEYLRIFANRLVWTPQLSLVDARQPYFTNLTQREWSGLRSELPKHVHVLTLERVSGDRLLVRLEYQAPEMPEYVNTTQLHISRLLKNQDIYHILETSLGSTQDKTEMVRFVWRRHDRPDRPLPAVSQEQRMRVWLKRGYRPRFEDTVVLHPGEIRTFVGRAEKVRPLPDS